MPVSVLRRIWNAIDHAQTAWGLIPKQFQIPITGAVIGSVTLLLGWLADMPAVGLWSLVVGTTLAGCLLPVGISLFREWLGRSHLPRFEFVEVVYATLTRNARNPLAVVPTSPHITRLAQESSLTFLTALVLIRNNPLQRSDHSDAHHVAARLRFYEPTDKHREFIGVWKISGGGYADLGAHGTAERIDIPANGIPVPLYVVLRPNGYRCAFAFDQANIADFSICADPRCELPLAEYRLDIVLSCRETSREQTLRFVLRTDGPLEAPLNLDWQHQ